MADKKPTRLPKDFNQNSVNDIEITNPERAAQQAAGIPVDTEYPKHLHKFAGHGQMHEFVEVTNAKDEHAKRKEGWMAPQEADAVGRAQAEDDAAAVKAPKAPKAAKALTAAAAPKAAKAKRAPKAKAVVEPGEPAAN